MLDDVGRRKSVKDKWRGGSRVCKADCTREQTMKMVGERSRDKRLARVAETVVELLSCRLLLFVVAANACSRLSSVMSSNIENSCTSWYDFDKRRSSRTENPSNSDPRKRLSLSRCNGSKRPDACVSSETYRFVCGDRCEDGLFDGGGDVGKSGNKQKIFRLQTMETFWLGAGEKLRGPYACTGTVDRARKPYSCSGEKWGGSGRKKISLPAPRSHMIVMDTMICL